MMFLRHHLLFNGLFGMNTKKVKASKDTVLFPDDLEIVEVVGERFYADNWFKLMSDRLKEQRSISKKF